MDETLMKHGHITSFSHPCLIYVPSVAQFSQLSVVLHQWINHDIHCKNGLISDTAAQKCQKVLPLVIRYKMPTLQEEQPPIDRAICDAMVASTPEDWNIIELNLERIDG